jgi:hypothetical protein
MGSLSGARTFAAAALALVCACALALASCGGGDDEPTRLAAEDVVAAFEDAAGGYEFVETTALVNGAASYGPHNSSDNDEVAPINEALGDASLLWQVVIFEGADGPVDDEAVNEVGSASDSLDEIAPGVFLGDNNIAYVAKGNVVIGGPVLDGDPDDPTLAGWKGVLDSL